MKLLPTIWIGILLLGMIGCKQPPTIQEDILLFRKTLYEDPETAFGMALELEKNYDEMSEPEKAGFGVLFYEVHEKIHQPLPLRDYLNFSIAYYNRTKNYDPLLHCHIFNARMFQEHDRYDEATQQALLACAYMDTLKTPNICGLIHTTLGEVAISQKEYEKAIEYLEVAIRFFEGNSTVNLAHAYRLIGQVYKERKEYQSAKNAIRHALALLPDSIHTGELWKELGQIYYQNETLDSALYYVRESLRYPFYADQQATRLYCMGLIYNQTGNTDSVSYYIQKALQEKINIHTAKKCYGLLTDLAVKEGNKEEIAHYLKKHREAEDSIRRLSRQPNIGLVEQLHVNNIETQQIRTRQRRIYILSGMVVWIAIAVTVVLYGFRKKEQNKAHTHQNKLERKELELHIKEVNTEIEKTHARNAAARRTARPDEKEEIDRKTYREALRLDAPDLFLKQMNKSLGGLPDRLKAEYPGISQKELIWCCLYLLRIPTTDISLLMDFKLSTQYKFKQRLTKKLNFHSTKDLEQMLYQKAGQDYQQKTTTKK